MKFLLLSLVVSALITSCTRNNVFEKNLPVEKTAWRYDQPMQFELLIEDTTSLYDLYLNVRHNDRYAWANLWLLLETHYPDGQTFTQRTELSLAETTGEWKGICTGDICFLRQLIGSNVRFPKAGTYKFTLVQDMREEPIEGLLDMGIRLERNKETI